MVLSVGLAPTVPCTFKWDRDAVGSLDLLPAGRAPASAGDGRFIYGTALPSVAFGETAKYEVSAISMTTRIATASKLT